ncbi:MAG: kynureninase, partial [Comamonadaceae bacterium]
MPLTQSDCIALDADDATPANVSLRGLRERFAPGDDGTLYFDASSIGPMPLDAPARMQALLEKGWAGARRRGWNELDWLQQPAALGAAIAPIIGAQAADVRVADSTSINQYKLLLYALAANAPRRVIVVERDVFPSNRYVAEGITQAGLAPLRIIDNAAALPAALAPGDVAVVALSHIDYRSSDRLDMAAINAQARAAGALTLWDLSHSAGAVAVDLRVDGGHVE